MPLNASGRFATIGLVRPLGFQTVMEATVYRGSRHVNYSWYMDYLKSPAAIIDTVSVGNSAINVLLYEAGPGGRAGPVGACRGLDAGGRGRLVGRLPHAVGGRRQHPDPPAGGRANGSLPGGEGRVKVESESRPTRRNQGRDRAKKNRAKIGRAS